MSLELRLNNLLVPVDHFTFKGGEEQVKIDMNFVPKGEISFVHITAKIKNSHEVLALALLVDAVSRLCHLDPKAEFFLNMPYIPYARQDRVMNAGEALSIKVFANIINSMGFDRVFVDDPHSDVAPALLNNVYIRKQEDRIVKFDDKLTSKDTVIIAPDAGARKKAQKVSERLRLPLIEAGKVRDLKTNEITGTAVFGDVKDCVCVIVDDICDGGRTFIALAQALKEKGAKRVILYVTHGIFSFGKQVILDGGVDEIYAYYDWTENF